MISGAAMEKTWLLRTKVIQRSLHSWIVSQCWLLSETWVKAIYCLGLYVVSVCVLSFLRFISWQLRPPKGSSQKTKKRWPGLDPMLKVTYHLFLIILYDQCSHKSQKRNKPCFLISA
jgi:hypothetical protein